MQTPEAHRQVTELFIMKMPLNRVFVRSGKMEAAIILAAAAIVVGVCGFIALSGAVRAGRTQDFDERLLRAPRDPTDLARTLGPTWLEEVARDLTALGGIAILCLVTAGVRGYF